MDQKLIRAPAAELLTFQRQSIYTCRSSLTTMWISACIIISVERVAPTLKFSFRGGEVRVHGSIPDEPDRRLELLHENVKKYGTVFNTVAPGTVLEGVLRRAS